MKSVDPNDLFVPARALAARDVDLFAGRTEELRKLLEAISISGSTVVVYGDRGVGKTTLARFAQAALGGDEKAAARAKSNLSYLRPERYISYWVECDRNCRNFNDVLRKLLQHPDAPVIATKAEPAAIGTHGWNGDDWEVEATFRDWVNATLASTEIEEIVVFIDEFDRLPDRSRVGEIAKNAVGFKFVIIGIGEATQDLVADHASLARTIQTVQVPVFRAEEIAAIFENAAKAAERISDYPAISFSSDFVTRAYEDSGGFPYLAQQIGHAAVRALGETGEVAVIELGTAHYDRAIELLFSSRHPGVADDTIFKIRNALAHSNRTAAVLTVLAMLTVPFLAPIELMRRLSSDERVGFFDILDQLVEDDILQRSAAGEERVRFASPVKRLLVRLLLRQLGFTAKASADE